MSLRTFLILLLLLFVAVPAYANAGIPMITLVVPGMAIILVPIIIFESWYVHRTLKVSIRHAIKTMASANIVSTIIGIPLTWIAWLLIEIAFGYSGSYMRESLNYSFPEAINLIFAVTIGAAWLGPSDSEAYWMVPTATIVLLIPFFYVSYLLERGIAKRFLKEISAEALDKSVFKANAYSYGLLEIIVLGWLIFSLITKTGT